MSTGSLRIYLGAAPGVGKTYAMLCEGRRRRARGSDVVVGAIETHGREATRQQLAGLEVVAPRVLQAGHDRREEMDVEAVLARRPDVALVDDLAHTNAPGSRHAKRWQDVELLLGAGIDVVSTLNIEHLESMHDVAERITGVRQHETIPDAMVRAAAQVELVDATPDALRRRLAHGNIYPPEQVDARLTHYFREGSLAALRELALLWLADQVDTGRPGERAAGGNRRSGTRERIVVGLTGAPRTEQVIRRAARLARRSHAELLGIHVSTGSEPAGPDRERLQAYRALLEAVGGRYHQRAGTDVAAALVAFARAEGATQLVVGATGRSRWSQLLHGSVVNRIVGRAGPLDVHVVSHGPARGAGLPFPALRRTRPALSRRRRLAGWLLVLAALPALTAVLAGMRSHVALSSILLLYLLAVVAAAAAGGAGPALVAAVAGTALVNWYFTPPIHTWSIARGEDLLGLVVYLVTATVVSALVTVAARRSADATRANAEAETLAGVAIGLAGTDTLLPLVARLRSAFNLDGAALLRRDSGGWVTEAADGQAPARPDDADQVHDLGDGLVLALAGAYLAAEDRRVLDAFAANLAVALDRRRLNATAAQATVLAQANELRSALLQAVSHDLRTPLASIKASVSSLRQPDIAWTAEESGEFLATIEDETDRLTALVGNLLDMSRVHAHAVAPALRPTALDDIVPAALASLGPRAMAVTAEVRDDIPAVDADPALLERVLANLVDNALTHAPGSPVRVDAGCVGERVLLRVVDTGPGIPAGARDKVFRPFQRLADSAPQRGTGVGLGLAVARGLTQAMGGGLSIEDTPGGGATMVVDLRVAR